uniref:chitin synthase n=1 Tax=Amphora coffeiformis TaxID=265554 RepID=A0A7S3P609_9STRA
MFKSRRNLERAKSPTPFERNVATLQEVEGLEERMRGARDRFSSTRAVTPQRIRPFSFGRGGKKTSRSRGIMDDNASVSSVSVSNKLDDLTRKIDEQKKVEDRIERLIRKVEQMSMLMEETAAKDALGDMEEGPILPKIDPSPVGTVLYDHDHVQWNMTAYKSYEPHPDMNYFPGLSWQAEGMECRQVISGIIPCFNEGGDELHRTVQGLRSQYMHAGWRLEAVIVMDGVDNMDPTMANYLETMFGIAVNSKDPKKDPFLMLPEAETIVIHAADQANCQRRIRVCATSMGGFSLVLKRTNRRKANSQMWWLGAHAVSIKCLYALATDCGTVFDRTTTSRLIQRLSDESDLHACTGFQRTMSSRMQGDTSWEFCLRPFDFILRMLQRFEFEVDHVSFKSVDNALGTMHVIPGPCGLYRYRSLGNLKSGLMQHYFQIFRRKSSSLIIGNVELVEDRIPGALLAFPLKPSKVEANMPSTGWSRTGYCHEALFYLEAEKPLSQLVKQRRRWLNGTYATYFWLLSERIISNSNQALTTRFVSWVMVALHIIQGITVRYSGPALLIVWMWRFGLFLPDIIKDPANIFDPTVAVADLEAEPFRLWCSIAFGGGYALLYIWFVLAHKPRAVPVIEDSTIVRYTEAKKWRSDKSSSFNPFVMGLSVLVNVLIVFLFIANAGGIIYTQGWEETPIIVKILLCICIVPFGLGFLDGLTRFDFRCFFNLLLSAIPALPMMVWFTVWLPAYATSKFSFCD